jgi:hypothetical protein
MVRQVVHAELVLLQGKVEAMGASYESQVLFDPSSIHISYLIKLCLRQQEEGRKINLSSVTQDILGKFKLINLSKSMFICSDFHG